MKALGQCDYEEDQRCDDTPSDAARSMRSQSVEPERRGVEKGKE